MPVSEQESPPDAVRPDRFRAAPASTDDARNPRAFVRSLSAPAPPVEAAAVEAPVPPGRDGPDWAEDERLDEVFSAWAAAALTAEVIADRRFMEEGAARATVEVAGSSSPAGPEAAIAGPAPESAPEPGTAAAEGGGEPLGPPLVEPAPAPVVEAHQPWTRATDDVIPRPRRRWRR